MQFRAVIKVLHCITTVFLLILVGGFLLLNQQDDSPDVLKDSKKINDRDWLYMTEHNVGGATVPVTYRYYVHSKINGSDQVIAKKLREIEPLITGMGAITDIQTDNNNRLKVTYIGRVLSLADDVDQLTFQIRQ